MESCINAYRSFFNGIQKEIKDIPVNKKDKRKMKSITKKIQKLNDNQLSFLMNANFSFILNTINDKENIVNNELSNKKIVKIIEDDDYFITNDPNYIFPDNLKNIKWAICEPMELTIASNGSIWINNSLWIYLTDIMKAEIDKYPIHPIQKNKLKEDIDAITLNIGYDKNNLLLSINIGVNRAMKITFNKKIDGNGKEYATVSDDQCFDFSIETSFIPKGKYTIKRTSIYGLLYGEKINSEGI